MDRFRKRIKKLRINAGKSQRDVAKEIGVSQVTVYKLEDGQTKMTAEYMQKFAELYNTSVDRIMSDNFKLDQTNTDSVKIDIISAKPCCGEGEEVFEEIVGAFRVPVESYHTITYSPPEKIKMLQVVGDSMKPTIDDGDYVIVDTSINSIGDGIYVIRTLAGLAVKRIQVGMDKVSIISDNPLYQPLTASVGEVKIIGKVVKIFNIVPV